MQSEIENFLNQNITDFAVYLDGAETDLSDARVTVTDAGIELHHNGNVYCLDAIEMEGIA